MYRIVGALLLVIGCSIAGRLKVAAERRNIILVGELIKGLNILICELEFRRTPLPRLCVMAADHTTGLVSAYFTMLAERLSEHVFPNVKTCSDLVINDTQDIPDTIKELLLLMGDSLGIFNINGQVEQLRYVIKVAEDRLRHMEISFTRFGYGKQTLWICAGIALAVVLI